MRRLVPRSRWLRVVVKLAAAGVLLVFGLGVALALTEVALRVLPGVMPAHAENRARLFANLASVKSLGHREIGFLYPPFHRGTMQNGDAVFDFTTDLHGFRNPSPWPPRADVVVVGDSVTFGFGVEDDRSWVSTMAQGLAPATVVNLALPGFGPIQQLRAYEAFGVALAPKLVVAGFFPANDFWDTARFAAWQQIPDRTNFLLWRDFGVVDADRIGVVARVMKSSYVGSLLWAATVGNAETYGKGAVVHDTRDGSVVLMPAALDRVRSRAQPDRPEFVQAFEALARLRDAVAARGGQLLIVLLPSKEEVYLPLLGLLHDDPMAPVRRALQDLGVPWLDVTRPLRERAATGEQLFFRVDGHPNRVGYELIAATVLRYLDTSGLAQRVGLSRTARRP
jgi:hypothetical protein